jgi:hypothetical protein
VLRSNINHSIYMKKPLFVTMYDFKQCFDKLWLEDSLISLWKLGINDEMLKLISVLNNKSEAVVKTSLGETEKFYVGARVKQGTVLGPLLASSSIGECCSEHIEGGANIGTSSTRSMAFVDDLLDMNHNLNDVHKSHQKVIFFAKKKRLPLNEDKCFLLPVNVKQHDATPILEVNGKEVQIYDTVTYLGDVFNKYGNNKDLVRDRVAKGLKCMISSMALCSEITLGFYYIQTLIAMYKIMFIPTVLYNCQAWCNMTNEDILNLKTLQLKFLKRCLHTPSSTAKCVIFLDIEYEINIRQLQFLHHILSLKYDDPVKDTYTQQTKYQHEKNWGNEVADLRIKYNITENDDEIVNLSKYKWKCNVKNKVYQYALEILNNECSEKSKTSQLSPYKQLMTQRYFYKLTPEDARTLFSVRSGTLDIKHFRKYKYEEYDSMCRLCGEEEETIIHILNKCKNIEKSKTIDDVYSLLHEDVQMIVIRTKEFMKKVDNLSEIKVNE